MYRGRKTLDGGEVLRETNLAGFLATMSSLLHQKVHVVTNDLITMRTRVLHTKLGLKK